MSNAQDSMFANALATMDSDKSESVSPAAPSTSRRRTAIVPEALTGDVSAYRVSVEGFPHLDIETSSRGFAVVLAHATARVTPGFQQYGAHLFMWNYTVTDSKGNVTHGIDMREEVLTARMIGK